MEDTAEEDEVLLGDIKAGLKKMKQFWIFMGWGSPYFK